MLALFGIGSIGCTPQAIAEYGTNGSACVEKLNNAAQLFNKRLISLVDELNSNLTNAKFTYLNPSGTSTANSLGNVAEFFFFFLSYCINKNRILEVVYRMKNF